MKKILQTLVLTGLVAAPALALAAEAEKSPHTVTGNVTLASDYRFRGISQTFGDPAIQGGFDYSHASGVYLGTWASNVSEAELAGANIEWDIYGGYNWAVSDDFSVNVGGLYYWYPGKDDAPVAAGGFGFDPNTFELYAGATWKWFNVKYSYSTTDYFGIANSDGTGYLEGNFNYTLPWDITLTAHLGGTYVSGSIAGVSNDDYTDWKIGVSKAFYGFNVGLAYVDTDVKASNVTWGFNTAFAKGTDTEDLADGTVVLTVGKTF
jgi:uncharacterized protein (TIGR02001 family)